jgi:sugar O-acyltransferase (sialic acid O-acetyltransferase NeuD family)
MSSIEEIIIVGTGGHAVSCLEVIDSNPNFRVAGFISNEQQTDFLGYPILGEDSDLPELAKIYKNACIGVGQISSAQPRVEIYYELTKLGFNLPSIISSSAHVSKFAHIGNGCMIMHGAVINALAKIGDNSIINSMALIEHGSQVGRDCHVSTGVLINGDCVIGSGSFIGSGASLKQGSTLPSESFIKMGEIVGKVSASHG